MTLAQINANVKVISNTKCDDFKLTNVKVMTLEMKVQSSTIDKQEVCICKSKTLPCSQLGPEYPSGHKHK